MGYRMAIMDFDDGMARNGCHGYANNFPIRSGQIGDLDATEAVCPIYTCIYRYICEVVVVIVELVLY